jgi:hypothetical protein
MPLLGAKAKGVTALAMDLTGEVYGTFSLTDTLSYQFGSSALQVLSWTSCLSIVPGILSTSDGWNKAHLSGRVKDLKGQALGWLQFFRGAIRTTASGCCLIPATGLSLALFFTASKTAATVASLLKGFGGALLGGASFLLALSGLIFIAHSYAIRKEMNQIGDDQKALEMLKQKPEYDLLYALGSTGLERVKEGSLVDAKEVMEAVYSENTQQIVISALYFTLSICATAITIASFFIVSSPMLLQMAIMDTCLGFIWLIADSVALIDSIKEDKPGQYDKTWIRFTFLFCSSIMIAAALLSNGLVPLLISCTLGLLLLLIHLTYLAERRVETKPNPALLLTA